MIEWIDKYNNLIQITIGLLSLIATIFVSFLIYWLQRRHEIEIEKIEENIRKSLLEEEAHKFLIDNEEEIEYLPWCVFATNLYRHKKHTRKIYTNFCRCSKKLQNEILNIAGFSIKTIKDTEWVDIAFDNLRQDIITYKLGNDYLYDNAKYFHRAFELYRENRWEITPQVFPPINTFKQFSRSCYTNGILNINEYIELDDNYVNGLVKQLTKSEDEILNILANALENRKLFKYIELTDDNIDISKYNNSKYFYSESEVSATAYLAQTSEKNKIKLIYPDNRIISLEEYSPIIKSLSQSSYKKVKRIYYFER